MGSVPLQSSTIRDFMGSIIDEYNSEECQDKITSISLEYEEKVVKVEAQINNYTVCIDSLPDGSQVLASSCTCNSSNKESNNNNDGKCRHVYAVLCRMKASKKRPIGRSDPFLMEERRRRQAKRQRVNDASVYVVLTCKSETESSSNNNHNTCSTNRDMKENYDQQIIGVFFSKLKANECAKKYCIDDLGVDETVFSQNDDNDDENNDTFFYKGSENNENSDESCIDKVWVEQKNIEDASSQFHC